MSGTHGILPLTLRDVRFTAGGRSIIDGISSEIAAGPATIILGDGRKADYRNIDVVVCYLLPEPLKKWKLIWEKQLPKGARVISYAFKIDGWKTVQEVPKSPEKNIAPIWVYEMGKQ